MAYKTLQRTSAEINAGFNSMGSAPGFVVKQATDTPYNRDEFVLYDEKMYKCDADEFYGPWDPSKWVETTITAEVQHYLNGYEHATIVAKTESAMLSGVTMQVVVEGENVTRVYTTNADGKCFFAVRYGLSYTITFGTVSGYNPLPNATYRAAIEARTITALYVDDPGANKEHVVVDATYVGSGAERAANLNVVTDSGTTIYPFVNSRCEFDVDLGTSYRIVFSTVEGFIKPADQTYTAALQMRVLNVIYVGAVASLSWLRYDGSYIPFENAVASDKPNIVGLAVAPSSLLSAYSAYVIPLAYLLGESAIGTKAWGPNAQFTSIKNYTSETMCLTDDGTNFSGQNNTLLVLEEAASKGYSCPAFTACNAVTYTVAGVEKHCFLGSYAQMKAFSTNRETIDLACFNIFGSHCITISSGYWWSSTQSSATYAVNLFNGGFGINGKNGSDGVVPFLAYQN